MAWGRQRQGRKMRTIICNRSQSRKCLGLNHGDNVKVMDMDIRNGWITTNHTPHHPALWSFPWRTQKQPKAMYVSESLSRKKKF